MGNAFKANSGLTDRGAIPPPEREPIDWKILYDTQKTNHFIWFVTGIVIGICA